MLNVFQLVWSLQDAGAHPWGCHSKERGPSHPRKGTHLPPPESDSICWREELTVRARRSTLTIWELLLISWWSRQFLQSLRSTKEKQSAGKYLTQPQCPSCEESVLFSLSLSLSHTHTTHWAHAKAFDAPVPFSPLSLSLSHTHTPSSAKAQRLEPKVTMPRPLWLTHTISLSLSRSLFWAGNELLESTSSAKAPRAHSHYAKAYMANPYHSLSFSLSDTSHSMHTGLLGWSDPKK